MKEARSIISLIAELVGGFGFLLLVTSVTGWVYFSIVTAVWAILMVLLVLLKKRR